jgi:16S rRNA (cytosine967-C5)-methyltransferase
MPVSPARAAAFQILLRIETADAYASELLHSSRFDRLSAADHALLTELVMGVLRWRSVLDDHIARQLTQPLAKLDFEVLTALRMGAYQMLFLTRIPRHAAVNDSVELVKRAKKRSAAGVVNAVLRTTARQSSPRIEHGREAKPTSFSESGQEAGYLGRTDPAHSEIEVRAHPEWLVTRWSRAYGAEAAQRICAYDQRPPKTTVRLNSALLQELNREGITLGSTGLLAKAFVVESGDIGRTQALRERRLIPQDEASQLVALLVGRAGAILDCCAAPGGKTRILAERNPGASIIALERHRHRAELLRKLVPHANVQVIAADARQLPITKQFDRALVDAPCSGTGTLARHPEIKWRLKPEDISRLEDYQLRILVSAMGHIVRGGRVIYSTCSLEPEENSEVIERALRADSSFHIVDCGNELDRLKLEGELTVGDSSSLLSGPYLRTVPGVHPCDGFFAAILEKN